MEDGKIGFGDEILVTGEARRRQEEDKRRRPVIVYNRRKTPRWHPLWEGNPRILKPNQFKVNHLRLFNGPGLRHYIDYDRMKREFASVFPDRKFTTKVHDPRLPYRFTDHRCTRGELYLDRLKPGGYVVVEPHFKPIQYGRNWGWDRWQDVVRRLPGIDWVQINPIGDRILDGVRHVPANSFLEACRQISGAALYVGIEGGLYHAAAAFDVPAVAIFGGFVSPANQGYEGKDYVNLYDPMDGVSPCGQRVPCEHCKRALANIKPEIVAYHVEQMLRK